MQLPAWRLENHRAELELNSWRIALDVAHPEQGLSLYEDVAHDITQSTAALRVLGVALSDGEAGETSIAECYVRGEDLVATYTIPRLATRVQIYWRAIGDAFADDTFSDYDGDKSEVGAIDLQVSVQTDVLDASPRVSTRSVLACDRAFRLLSPRSAALKLATIDPAAGISLVPDGSPTCLIFPLRGGEDMYVEMVHPADFRQCQISQRDENAIVEHCLFAEKDLEKGVIMRARVRGLLIRPSAAGEGPVEAIAAEAYARFVEAPPPLTT